MLVVASPGAGHVNPLLPLVEALLAGGDRVVVSAGDDPGGVVARSGAEFRIAGHGDDGLVRRSASPRARLPGLWSRTRADQPLLLSPALRGDRASPT